MFLAGIQELGTGPPINTFGGDASDDPFVIHLGNLFPQILPVRVVFFDQSQFPRTGSIFLTVFLLLLLRSYPDAIRNKQVDELHIAW